MLPLSVATFLTTAGLRDQVQAALIEESLRTTAEEADESRWPLFLEKVERSRPDAVLLDIYKVSGTPEERIRALRRVAPDAMVIAISNTSDGEEVLRAIRAGADEYVYPPVGPNLKVALERGTKERSRVRNTQREPGKVFGVVAAKGGSGATTIACHLAVELGKLVAAREQHVLLADLDLDAGMIGFLMKSNSGYTVADALENVHRLDDSYWKGLITNGRPGLEVITAPESSFESTRPTALREVNNIIEFVRYQYPWTIVDLGRGISPMLGEALKALDEIYLVTHFDLPALHRAKQILASAVKAGYPKHRLRLVINRVSSRTELMPQELEKTFDLPVFASFPEDSAVLFDSYCDGTMASPQSPFGRKVAHVARKIAGVPEVKRKFSLFG
jgi:pilus assembly protein CpaE